MENHTLNKNDLLAIERTKLANERTFLAYFRTFIVFLSSGFVILKMTALEEIWGVGIFLMIIGPLLLLVGILRFFYVRKKLRRCYQAEQDAPNPIG